MKKDNKVKHDIFSELFIDSADNVKRIDQNEFIVTCTVGGAVHAVRYKIYLNDFRIKLDVFVDDVPWIYNAHISDMENIIWLFRKLSDSEFEHKERQRKEMGDSIKSWVGISDLAF